MVHPIPDNVLELWNEWNIRAIILFSLALQAFLIVAAPLRKRSSRKLIIFSLWTAYLLADWAANFAVGHISSKQTDKSSAGSKSSNRADGMIQAFWAPFLLLHLGGPDTITAFALEDNELWLRHLLGLVTQVFMTAYVFIQTVPGNDLWIPTVLMFVGGIIKYAERTRALYKASLNSFRESLLKTPDPGPNYAKLMEEYSSKKEARLPTVIQLIAEPDTESRAFSKDVAQGDLKEIEIVTCAHYFFNIFKGLIVDSIFSFKERDESREFFMIRTAVDAYRVIEVELNFMYEVLFTKIEVVHNLVGYIFRFLAFGSTFVTLGLFYVFDKDDFKPFDVKTTYSLLLGAIFLDVVALFNLIFSDWTVVGMEKYPRIRRSSVSRMFECFLKLQRPYWHDYWESNFVKRGLRTALFRRWTEAITGYNFITYNLRERPDEQGNDQPNQNCIKWSVNKINFAYGEVFKYLNKISEFVTDNLGLTTLVDDLKYAIRYRMNGELWNFIFKELQEKAEDAEDPEIAKRICEAKGSYVLLEGTKYKNKEEKEKIKKLLPYIDEVTYDESLLLWHIATELCYQHYISECSDKKLDPKKNYRYNEHYQFCKVLSDYMLYLLVLQPTMMSAIAGIGQIRFRDTSEEAKKFFVRRGKGKGQEKEACLDILGVDTEVKPETVKGDRSKSVLFDACMLAKELDKFEEKIKWEILSSVWVEMLSYAASHCRPESHAQQVSKGGELITFVWLLMSHLGLGDQFQIKEGHARAKLIVQK
ncbi:hypothetical protein F8388_020273 [Cannabis sativa]|uniref:DUF4220 domain-containing protein n=1 Tax=Cannabis sativa TaxID=3483 RepID=A0A7J6FVU4_CANSA|nr:hypothetical protein F8388_020273 [Cannabis sativa]